VKRQTKKPKGLDASEMKTAEAFVRHLSAAARNRLFYPTEHSILKRSFANLKETAASLLETRPEINVGLLEDDWLIQGTVLHKSSALAPDLKQRLRDRDLTSVTLLEGFTETDLNALVGLLTASPEEIKERGPGQHLRSLGASAAAVGRLALAGRQSRPGSLPGGTLGATAPARLLSKGADVISQLYKEAGEGSLDLDKARGIVADVMGLVNSGSTELSSMLDLKSHDDYTFTHIVNVCVLTLGQTRGMDLSEDLLNEIGLAALMHDIGKQRIPAEIIRKPSRLTAEEFELMKKHTIYGAEMLRAMPGSSDLSVMVAFEHHMRYDCTGYPKVKNRRELNICTHMTTIADAFDAMRTLRPYSEKMSAEEVAIRMQADSGTHFEPALLKRFFRMLDLFSPGSSVSLSTGEEAVVVERRVEDCMRPIVRVTKDAEGMPLVEGPTMDLSDPARAGEVKITGGVRGAEPSVEQERQFSRL
jgi:HD-GYP domain-containing protein (c-di-GMP phosphodiesterase class II)